MAMTQSFVCVQSALRWQVPPPCWQGAKTPVHKCGQIPSRWGKRTSLTSHHHANLCWVQTIICARTMCCQWPKPIFASLCRQPCLCLLQQRSKRCFSLKTAQRSLPKSRAVVTPAAGMAAVITNAQGDGEQHKLDGTVAK